MKRASMRKPDSAIPPVDRAMEPGLADSAIRLRWAALFAIILSLVYIHNSELAGRLAFDLGYDDVVYAREAADRLLTLETRGGLALLRDLIEHPPHSVFSTLLASIGFKLGGVSEFALYASNVVILLALAAFVVSELKTSRGAVVFAAFAFVLLSPLSRWAIQDFRPDIALGLSTAMMAVWYIRGALYNDTKSSRRAGLALGASLLIKPTFFAHTLAMAALLSAISVISNRLAKHRWNLFPATPIREVLRIWGIGLLLSIPYFALNGRQIFSYFWSNTRGENAHLWSHAAETSTWDLLQTFLAYAFVLAEYHLPLSVMVLIVALVLLAQSRRYVELKRFSLQAAVACASLAIIIVGRHKNEFFLATFLWLLTLTAAFALVSALQEVAKRRQVAIASLLAIAVVLSMGSARRQSISPEVVRGPSSWNQIIFNTVRDDFSSFSGASEGNRPSIFFSFVGRVNGDTLAWIGYRDRYVVDASGAFVSGDLKELKSRAAAHDYLVVPNPGLADYDRSFPSGQIQSQVLDWALDSRDFIQIRPVTPAQRYFVFRNKDSPEKHRDVVRSPRIVSIEGFLPQEGPYPSWSLPKVRWMSSRNSRICTHGAPKGLGQLTLRARAEVDGVLRITAGDRLLGEVSFLRHVFQDARFDLGEGQLPDCIEFEFKPAATDATADRWVLFSQLDLGGGKTGTVHRE
jgi:hypothetical protein